MSHDRILENEKLRVLTFSLGLMLLVYFLFSDFFVPVSDPMLPILFISTGEAGKLAVFLMILFLFIFIASIFMIRARVSGVMLVAVVGMGGVAAKSSGDSLLPGAMEGTPGELYGLMLVEILIFGFFMLLAETLAFRIRDIISGRIPAFRWSGILDSYQNTPVAKLDNKAASKLVVPREESCLSVLLRQGERKNAAMHLLVCTAAGLVITTALMRTDARGQILFSVFTGFAIAAMLSCRFFPTGCLCASWGGALAASVVIYLSSVVSVAWEDVLPIKETLPVDWITAGCGGSLFGYWVSRRMKDYRLVEILEDREAE